MLMGDIIVTLINVVGGGLIGCISTIMVAKINARGKTAQESAFEATEAREYEDLFRPVASFLDEPETVRDLIEKASHDNIRLPRHCRKHYQYYLNAPEERKADAYRQFKEEVIDADDYYKKYKCFGKYNTGRWRSTYRPFRISCNRLALWLIPFVVMLSAGWLTFKVDMRICTLAFMFAFMLAFPTFSAWREVSRESRQSEPIRRPASKPPAK